MQKLYGKYQGHLLEDAGSYNSRDFINFANYAKRRMKAAAEEKGIDLIRFSTGHYEFSGCFQSEATGKYVYFSYSPQRREPIDLEICNCFGGFLLRTAEGPKDFKGGRNHFTNLKGFLPLLEQLVS